jgi:DNA-binding NarL/FixJ family response regulator
MHAPARAPTSVVVADDDGGIRHGLAALLAEEPDFIVVGEAADGVAALALARDMAPALVVVDVRMPGGGPDLVRALCGLQHRPQVVALSAASDAATWSPVLIAGACGYLRKGALAADLPALLRRCCAGELILAVPGAADVVRRLLSTSRGLA